MIEQTDIRAEPQTNAQRLRGEGRVAPARLRVAAAAVLGLPVAALLIRAQLLGSWASRTA
jgi:hypothetical protein